MKRTREITEKEIKTEIQRIINDAKIINLTKIEQIIGLGQPTPVKDTKVLQFGVYPEVWQELKTNHDYWLKISQQVGVPDFYALDNEGNYLFGLSEVYNAAGSQWMNDLSKTFSLGEYTPNQQKKLARDEFKEYMSWFDAEADIQFLVLYAYYRTMTADGNKYVFISETKQHKAAPLPRFKETSIPPVSTIPKETKVEIEPPPLDLKREDKFYVQTAMRIVLPQENKIFHLYQKKNVSDKPPFYFTIQLARNEYTIETKGIITRVLKFVDDELLYVIISGESDNTLIRIQYRRNGFPYELDEHFPKLDPDLFDDITYYNSAHPSIIATNMKSVNALEDLRIFDITVLSGLKGRSAKASDLSPEERRRYIRQQTTEAGVESFQRLLTEEERRALATFRRLRSPTLLPPNIKRGDILPNELEAIRKATGYINLEKMIIIYGNLLTPITPPLAPSFKSGPRAYTTGDIQLLAAKVIRVPSLTRLDVFVLAILARQYTSNSSSTIHLHLIKYSRSTIDGFFKPGDEKRFNVSDFLLNANEVLEFNLIFHTEIFFYIEVLQQATRPNQVVIRTSEVLEFNFAFLVIDIRSGLSASSAIKDYTILSTLARNGYKIYDFRHDIVPDIVVKFDAIYYKYDYDRERARLIFYKAREGRAAIADMYVNKLSPGRIIAFTPLIRVFHIGLLQIRVEPGKHGLFLIQGKAELLTYEEKSFSLATHFQRTLSLAGHEKLDIKIEEQPHCVFCGEYTNELDKMSGFYYCDKLCQLLFCTTNAL